jgi:hypothetical protein
VKRPEGGEGDEEMTVEWRQGEMDGGEERWVREEKMFCRGKREGIVGKGGYCENLEFRRGELEGEESVGMTEGRELWISVSGVALCNGRSGGRLRLWRGVGMRDESKCIEKATLWC